MTLRSAWLPLALAVFCGSSARAQLAGVVQLPTFNVFTVQTTVSAPDSGGAYVGGLGRRFSTGVRRGPLNRGTGAGVHAGGVRVTTRVIDHAEHDRLVLRGAASGEVEQDEFTRKLADADESTAGRPAESVAAIRRRKASENAAAAAERRAAGEEHLRQGRLAEQAGRLASARSHYYFAARKLDGHARREALDRLAAVRALLAAPPAENESRDEPRTPDESE